MLVSPEQAVSHDERTITDAGRRPTVRCAAHLEVATRGLVTVLGRTPPPFGSRSPGGAARHQRSRSSSPPACGPAVRGSVTPWWILVPRRCSGSGWRMRPTGVEMLFEDFVVARGPSLVRFAHALSGDRHLAEDLVQEVLVKAHRGWDRLDHPEAYVRRDLPGASELAPAALAQRASGGRTGRRRVLSDGGVPRVGCRLDDAADPVAPTEGGAGAALLGSATGPRDRRPPVLHRGHRAQQRQPGFRRPAPSS